MSLQSLYKSAPVQNLLRRPGLRLNLPEGYIQELEQLDERKRQRFLLGVTATRGKVVRADKEFSARSFCMLMQFSHQ